MKLLSGPLSMFGAKTEIAVHEKGLDVTIEHVPFSIATLYEPKHPDVARINPKQQVPILIDGDLEIFDSTQIFEYFEDLGVGPRLWPEDPHDRARARSLELQADEVFFPNVVAIMPAQRKRADARQIASAIDEIHAYYDRMERRLAGRRYLAGEFSFADIAFFMAQFFASFLGEPWKEPKPNLDAWKELVAKRPSVGRVAGTMTRYLAEQLSR
jgi:glutathione S-transferase